MVENQPLDPITFEVLRHGLVAIADEMAVALRWSAHSTNIKTRADFLCALFDERLRTVAQASCQPIHHGSIARLVPRAVTESGRDRLGPGDGILTNDPYRGGVHLNDITLISPVYIDGRLIAYVSSLTHHVDVGGGAAASIGAFREVFEEGVIIPPVRFVESGELVPDVFRLVMAQVRAKRETACDFRAQIAANNTGSRRLSELVSQYGIGCVRTYIWRRCCHIRPDAPGWRSQRFPGESIGLKGSWTVTGTRRGQCAWRSGCTWTTRASCLT